ncbi:hypothetical protein CDD83_9482 [Cordyceps sp. RAO-2017]|nr:hypothetical protein CDD83_9482 [Cordyceps sp. RAO-2017]
MASTRGTEVKSAYFISSTTTIRSPKHDSARFVSDTKLRKNRLGRVKSGDFMQGQSRETSSTPRFHGMHGACDRRQSLQLGGNGAAGRRPNAHDKLNLGVAGSNMSTWAHTDSKLP